MQDDSCIVNARLGCDECLAHGRLMCNWCVINFGSLHGPGMMDAGVDA